MDSRPLGIHRPPPGRQNTGYHSSSSPERSSASDYYIDSSTNSLPYGSRSRSSNSSVSRAYKEAANYFLTRQMAEAFAILRPVLRDAANPSTNRTTRVKVWCLYFAIYDAAVKMTPEEGKRTWDGQDWRRIVGRVRNGLIWDEVTDAYRDKGSIDPDVVIELVLLVLSHGTDQTVTQKKIESYLAESPAVTEGPKALAQRVKLMELYILHVLPRVNDWDYAREFTQMSPYLDADTKDSFLSTLQNLEQEKVELEAKRLEEERLQIEALEREQRLAEEKLRAEAAAVAVAEQRPRSARRGSRAGSDYGTVRSRRRSQARSTTSEDPRPRSRRGSRSRRAYSEADSGDDALSTASSAYGRKQTNVFAQTGDLANSLIRWINMSVGGQKIMQTAVIAAAVVLALAKRSTRTKLWRFLVMAWLKTSKTVGMGMKVTYV